MTAEIVCDLCNKAVRSKHFASHYETCVGTRNAFEVIMGKDSTLNSIQSQATIVCTVCGESYSPTREIRHLTSEKHKNAAAAQLAGNENVTPIITIWKSKWKSYRVYSNKGEQIDLQELYKHCREDLAKVLLHHLSEYVSVRFVLRVCGPYVKQTDEETNLENMIHFATSCTSLFESELAIEKLDQALEHLRALSSKLQEETPMCALQIFKFFEITINKLNNVPGGGFIKAPPEIRSRRALINVRNKDEFCFKWCVLASLAHDRYLDTTFKTDEKRKRARRRLAIRARYGHLDISRDLIYYYGIRLDFSGIEFPITIKGIKRFELNNVDFSVNIYKIDDSGSRVFGPTTRASEIRSRHIDLLCINNERNQISHYALIASMRKLLHPQYKKPHFCQGCLKFYDTTDSSHNTKMCRQFAAANQE